MNDEIEPATYKKWFGKYSGEKAFLVSEIQKLNSDQKERWKKAMVLLPNMVDVPAIFEKAEILDQHSLIREVFKHPLTYKDGQCRTPTINPGFSHNYLKIKEKGSSKSRSLHWICLQIPCVPGTGIEPVLPLRETGF